MHWMFCDAQPMHAPISSSQRDWLGSHTGLPPLAGKTDRAGVRCRQPPLAGKAGRLHLLCTSPALCASATPAPLLEQVDAIAAPPLAGVNSERFSTAHQRMLAARDSAKSPGLSMPSRDKAIARKRSSSSLSVGSSAFEAFIAVSMSLVS